MIIGVDIGGTKTLVATFKNHIIVREDRFATNQDSAVFLQDLIPLLRSHAGNITPDAISIAAPGVIDFQHGAIMPGGNIPWRNFAIRDILQKEFHCPIYLENDCTLAGLAEANAMHPIPKLCLYITVSTGIGSGIVINGKPTQALSNSEAGQMMLRRGDHFVRWEHSASGKALFERTGVMASEQRDEAVWADQAERVADGLLALIPVLLPSCVVIGGSIGAYLDNHWRGTLERLLEERMSPIVTVPPIIQAHYPKDGVLHGCKLYAEQYLNAR